MTDETKITPPSDDELTLTTIQLNLHMLRSDVNELELQMQKLHEVYYHIFPDRLRQDLKIGTQPLDVMRSSKPDPDTKQS